MRAPTSNNQVLSGVKAINPTTLQVTLSSPFADFPSTLGHPVTWAFPPQLADTPTKEKAFEKYPGRRRSVPVRHLGLRTSRS